AAALVWGAVALSCGCAKAGVLAAGDRADLRFLHGAVLHFCGSKRHRHGSAFASGAVSDLSGRWRNGSLAVQQRYRAEPICISGMDRRAEASPLAFLLLRDRAARLLREHLLFRL